MKIKYFFISLLAIAFSLNVAAKNNPGVDFIALGELEMAKEYFMKTMRQAPANSYYYLGEIAYEQGDMNEALKNFKAGIAGNPESPLSKIGMAKMDYKSNPKEAEKVLNDLKKVHKKDATVLIEIARAFKDNGNLKKEEEALKEARKIKDSPLVFVYEGLRLQKAGKAGEAGSQFDQALNVDANFILAHMKNAQVYASINRSAAIKSLEQVLEIDPDYILAYKAIAGLYYNKGQYKKAIAAYEKLFESGIYADADITDFAACQYFDKDYTNAVVTLEEGLKKNPNDFVLNRLMMYSKAELEQYDEANKVAEVFFAIPRDTVKYLPQDHMTYAKILGQMGERDAAIVQYEKLIELDPTQVELFKEIAQTCAKDRLYSDAGDYYMMYIDKVGENALPTDYFSAGRYFYQAGGIALKDSTQAEKLPSIVEKGDKMFSKVMAETPEVPLGYLWRARINTFLDPESTEGIAKPHYESLVEVIEKEAASATEPVDRSAELKEAYTYLSYYNYLQFANKMTDKEAKNTAMLYIDKLLEVDENNPTGKQLKEVLSQY